MTCDLCAAIDGVYTGYQIQPCTHWAMVVTPEGPSFWVSCQHHVPAFQAALMREGIMVVQMGPIQNGIPVGV